MQAMFIWNNNNNITYALAEWLAFWTQAQKGPGSNRSPLKDCEGNCRPAESNGSLPPGL